MRLQCIATVAIFAALAAAKPHALAHRHAHGLVKRHAQPSNVVYAPAAVVTKTVFVLNDHPISEEEVRQGIANGTLVWGEDGNLSTSISRPVALATPPPAPSSSNQPGKEENKPKPQSAPPAEKPAEKADASQTGSDLVDKDGHCASCDKEFPNGKIPCTEFPYGYGALPISNEGLGGWSGIQDPQYSGADGFNDITTIPKGSCKDGSCCKPGSFCSYGCPNPYLKLSFPKKQGVTGQSVGGLYCNDNGYLEMADNSLGKTLCGQSSKSMIVKVQNKLSKSVSFCRTDYPGTESMTFPLTVGPGETGFLANPDLGKYYFWKGMKTSAHYYVNKQGVPEGEACTWGKEMGGKGNWSPTIFGTSFDDSEIQTGFSSLKQNELCKGEPLDYDITFTGNAVNGACKYKKATNQYCQGDDCWDDKTKGCTASTKKGGTLLIVLSD